MKKVFAVMIVLMLVLFGCSEGTRDRETENGDINIKNERLVKEFAGTVNIFHRYFDNLLLSAEEGDDYKYYDIDIGTGQVKESELTDIADRYFYYEPIGNKGFIVVEDSNYRSTMKFIGKERRGACCADDIGPPDAIISQYLQRQSVLPIHLFGGR